MGAPKGNRYTQKYTEEQAIELFIKAADYAITNDECLSVQDAVIHIDIPHSTFYDLAEKHKVLDNIKKEINSAVIARINKGALLNEMNPTAAIWRAKQLGETDKQVIEETTTDKAALLKLLPDKERVERIKELMGKLNL